MLVCRVRDSDDVDAYDYNVLLGEDRVERSEGIIKVETEPM
jgi:hypothetical protein